MVRVFALFIGLSAAPAAEACRLALILGIDVSSSIDATEDSLQRAGLANALISPDVEAAFFASPDPVSVFVFAWSGRYNQQVIVDWTAIDTPAQLTHVAQKILQSQRKHDDFPTAMGYALGYAAGQFARVPACNAKTIDMAGDGPNNDGFGPANAYGAFPFDGVTVNGLVVTANEPAADQALIDFYQNEVRRGRGSFVEVAQGFEDFQTAMERKLLRELLPMLIGAKDLTLDAAG